MGFEGRVALVTGGAGGIGSATCARLAAEGARVVVADLDATRARDVASEFDGLGVQLDVRSTKSTRAVAEEVEAELGPIDVLVNNAGVAEDDFFVRTTEEMWDHVIAVNLRGAFAMTHAVLPGMQERGRGAIVNVASEAGRVGSELGVVYSASKAGMIGFTKALARETARRGVRVNAVAAGPIETPMLRRPADALGQVGERFVRGMIAATAMRRAGAPEEVAGAIAYLAGDDASFVTGETIGVSGGLGMM
jgi:2-hydroxycyclohexanecarboxyl-CoA dehydrogenase